MSETVIPKRDIRKLKLEELKEFFELPPEEQEVLADVINKRIIERKRNEIINFLVAHRRPNEAG